LVPTNGR